MLGSGAYHHHRSQASVLQPSVPQNEIVYHPGDHHEDTASFPWLFEQVRDLSMLARAGGAAPCTECPSGYNSVLRLRNQLPRAGLHDRFIIMYHAKALATSLCARLAIAPPARMLSREHNRGQPVNASWWWDRYFRSDFVQDIDAIDWNGPQANCTFQQSVQQHGRPYICTLNGSDVAHDHATAQRHLRDGKPFVWELNVNWWHLQKPIRFGLDLPIADITDGPTLSLARQIGLPADPNSRYTGYPHLRTGGCFYHLSDENQSLADPWRPEILASFESPLVANMTAKAKAALGVAPESLYTLHIRRRDALPGCNTTTVAVIDHMRCSDSRWNATDSNDTLVVFTDETDATYLHYLTTSLGHLPRWKGRVVHGDPVIRNMLATEHLGIPESPESDTMDNTMDNYLGYMVESMLAWAAGHAFEMRRCDGVASCEDEGEKFKVLRQRLRANVDRAMAEKKERMAASALQKQEPPKAESEGPHSDVVRHGFTGTTDDDAPFKPPHDERLDDMAMARRAMMMAKLARRSSKLVSSNSTSSCCQLSDFFLP